MFSRVKAATTLPAESTAGDGCKYCPTSEFICGSKLRWDITGPAITAPAAE